MVIPPVNMIYLTKIAHELALENANYASKTCHAIFAQVGLHFIGRRGTLYTQDTDRTDKDGFFKTVSVKIRYIRQIRAQEGFG